MMNKLQKIFSNAVSNKPTSLQSCQNLLQKFQHRMKNLESKNDADSKEEFLIVQKLIEKLQIQIKKEQLS